ncbi:hypothetical protein MNB_SUP05-10-1154 [hydrothermal vent metagenome]|uniref:Uncharacterized protein n=1 Tax=hydrothermal vent metagenome TaxID=652676 RepID=A0A1W1D7N7_9ZZZZ
MYPSSALTIGAKLMNKLVATINIIVENLLKQLTLESPKLILLLLYFAVDLITLHLPR